MGTILRHGSEEQKQKWLPDRKSTRLNSSHGYISYAVFCLKKKKKNKNQKKKKTNKKHKKTKKNKQKNNKKTQNHVKYTNKKATS